MASDIPDPHELNSEDKILMIFDDLLLEKQTSANVIMFAEDMVTWTAFTFSKLFQTTKTNYQRKRQLYLPFSSKS